MPEARTRWVVAIDKFRGTATQAELTAVVADVAGAHGIEVVAFPTADGGEGLLEVYGAPNRSARVTGPLGEPVTAAWYDDGRGLAVVESARASGLLLAGGSEGNDPWAATSRGTGELVLAARAAGAERIVVGLGGSACTDGGRGALDVLAGSGIDGIGAALTVFVDVETRYLDAARVFGPQKGADAEVVVRLEERLGRERARLVAEHGIDPQALVGSGAAGGLAGGLSALGATLVPGFAHVAEVTGLARAVRGADLVLTGEGRLDATSLAGKVVGGVAGLAADAGVRVVAVVGDADPAVVTPFRVVSLTELFGRDRALADTLACVRAAVEDLAR